MRYLLFCSVLVLAGCEPASKAGVAAVVVPPPQPFCTRTLGVAQCFSDPASLPDQPPGLADGTLTLTPAQEKDRAATARWAF